MLQWQEKTKNKKQKPTTIHSLELETQTQNIQC